MSKQLTALEIANELENRFYNIYPAQQAVSMLRSQQAEIEALKAHPVNPYKVITDTKIEPTVVSYTHPVELTDEEIIKTMVQFDVYSADDQCLIEAGRAILRKAQEVNLI